MTDEPENLVLRHLQEIRAEVREGFESAARHAAARCWDVAEEGRTKPALTPMARIHADVLATKSLVLDVVVKLTRLSGASSC